MVSYANKDLFLTQPHDKTLSITGTGINISNTNIRTEEFSLEETLNSSDTLNFGECNAAKLTFVVGYYANSIAGKTISAKITPTGGADFVFGSYKVLSDEPTADKRWREVVAYDAMYDLLKADVTSWFNTLLPDANSSCTLKQFRDSLFTHFGITQKSITLVNDSMTVTRTIDPANLTGKTVLNAICQINGVFGKIGRNGNFEYLQLQDYRSGLQPHIGLYPHTGLYPSPSGFGTNKQAEDGTYLSCKYEDYMTNVISKVSISNSENYEAGTAGSGTNVFAIKDNFLVFDKTTNELNTIAANLLAAVDGIKYRPCELEMVCAPWLETGDGIRIVTVDGKHVDTYILKRKIKGIQALFDTVIADGLQSRPNDGNTTSEQIVQVKGNVRKVEADLIEAKTIIAQEIQVERAKIDALSAIAITTQNLSAQTISAGQIKTGTLDCSKMTVTNLSADSITTGTLSVDRLNINALLLSFEGKAIGCDSLIAGTVRTPNLTLKEASTPTYHSCFLNTINFGGTIGDVNYVGWS